MITTGDDLMAYYDWAITVFLVVAMLVAAFYTKSKTRDVADFIVAGRKVRKWLGMSAMQASGTGIVSIALLGQEGFSRGFSYYWVTLAIGMVALIFFGVYGFGIERFRSTNAMTAAQFHEMRYSRGVRILVGVVMGVGGILNMALFPIIAARFLCYFLGWPESFLLLGLHISTPLLIVGILLSFAVLFALIGGQVTVVLTDYIQSVLMAVGFFIILFLVSRSMGILPVFEEMYELKGDAAFNPLLSGSYGITWIVWSFAVALLGTFSFGVSLNRLATAANPKVTRQIVLLSTVFTQGRVLMFLFFGVAAYITLRDKMPVGLTGEEYHRVVVGMFFHQFMPPLMCGFMLAVFLFAEIATDDSYILTWASIIVNDVICTSLKKPLLPKEHLFLLKCTVVVIAGFIFFWGAFYKPSESILNYLTLTGTMWLGGGIALLFGLYWKRANTAGAYAAVLSCMLIPLADMILRQILTPQVYHIRHQDAGLLAIGVGTGLLIIFSLFSSGQTKFVNYGQAVKLSEIHD